MIVQISKENSIGKSKDCVSGGIKNFSCLNSST
jgi:hypothetical protein